MTNALRAPSVLTRVAEPSSAFALPSRVILFGGATVDRLLLVGHGAAGWVFRGCLSDGAELGLKVAVGPRRAAAALLRREAIARAIAPACGAPIGSAWVAARGASADVTHPALAFRWVTGVTLNAWVEARAGRHSVQENDASLLTVARQLATTLARLHAAGLRHGDVKPGNVIVDGDDDTLVAALVDLSLAESMETAIAGGTPEYLAPEILDGGLAGGAEADVFALGKTIAWARAQLGLATSRAAKGDWLAGLLATRPGDRPAAATLSGWAPSRMPLACAYLVERLPEIERVLPARARVSPTRAQPWIHGLSDALAGLAFAEGTAREAVVATRELPPLDRRGRSALLLRVAGPGADRWTLPPSLDDEGALLEAIARAEEDEHGVLTAADLLSRTTPEPMELASVVAEVARDSADVGALDRLSRAVGARATSRLAGADQVERAALAMLRRAGRAADALPLANDRVRLAPHDLDRIAEAAEIARQAGDRARSLALVEMADAATTPAIVAQRIRLHLDAGELADADRWLAIAESTPSSESPALAEVRALRAWRSGAWADGLSHVEGAWLESSTVDAERRARLANLRGMLLHGAGAASDALRAFSRAGDLALAIASSSLEATARAGAAAAGHDAGHFGEAIEAAERAIALFSRTERVADRARARLSRAATLLAIGARTEAIDEAMRAVDDAELAHDRRALAYACWVAIESRVVDLSCGESVRAQVDEATSATLRSLADRAETAIGADAGPDDLLLATAWRIRLGFATTVVNADVKDVNADANASARELVEGDLLAGASESLAARWAWAHARLFVTRAPSANAAVALDSDATLATAGQIVESIVRLGELGVAPSLVGPALADAASVARQLGRGEVARSLEDRLARLVARVATEVPRSHRASFDALRWVHAARPGARDEIDRADAIGMSPGQIDVLVAIARGLRDRTSLADLLRQVVDGLVLWVGAERGLLLLRAPDYDPAGHVRGYRLQPRVARGLSRKDLTGEQLALSTRLARRALDTLEPVVAVDALHEASSDPGGPLDGDPGLQSSIHALRLRSVLAVPLVARGEPLGVVYVDDRMRRGAFGPREVAWVRLLATQAASAIADARDTLRLRRLARRADRARAQLEEHLARTEGELAVARTELARKDASIDGADPRGTRHRYPAIVGDGAAIRRMLHLVDRLTDASDARIPVLISGESGTGKELVARAIHDNGPRKARAFVGENCGAIPESLLESTLFGHVRGAFTGADRSRAGLFEVAHGGTLFLDEIGEMGAAMQAKLLRALQEGEIRPVGANKSQRVDVRVVAATHRDLEERVRAGQFREDLFYRIAVVAVAVPPLRDRPEDIPALVAHVIGRFSPERSIRVSKRALAALATARWPGNVRQLENELRRALVLCEGTLDLEHLSPEIAVAPLTGGAGLRADLERGDPTLRAQVDALETRLVVDALRRAHGNQTQAAKALGLSRFGLQKMLKRLGLQARPSP